MSAANYLSAIKEFILNKFPDNSIWRFKIEGDLDREIHRQISELINEPDIDGRFFRDRKWNYSILLSLADKNILSDYKKLIEV